MEYYDVVVVGVGVWGLSAAYTFLTIEPSTSLLMIDSKKSVGGVWATEQLYPGLRTNNLQGYYEFTNFPMLETGVGAKPREHLSGETMHAYLEKFAEHFDLKRRMRLGTQVLRAVEDNSSNVDTGWELELKDTSDDDNTSVSRISCGKLILATGQASSPYKPAFKGLASFKRPIIHSVDLGTTALSLISDESVKDVTVVGGSKSAHDAVYMFASAGKHVNWIIHSTSHGRGAVPMAKPISAMGPWTLWIEDLLMRRSLAWFGAAPWSDGDGFSWIRWFLHSTRLGNSLVKGFFRGMSDQGIQKSGILDDEKTRVLLPGDLAMWYGTQASSIDYDTDFYELVRNDKASVTLGNIDQLEDGRIYMEDGIFLDTDVLVLATGYDYSASVPLEPAAKRLGWGCPVDLSEDTTYPDLDAQSDKEVLSRFMLLNSSPSKAERLPSLTPWRLWRFLAPPSQLKHGSRRNLVFMNTINSYQTFIRSELTSLWAYAYLHNRLTVRTPSEQEARCEVSLWTRFGKWRTPYGLQGKQADFLLDSMAYYDLLLRDLGLRSWRKGWGWFGEVFGGAYDNNDYKGLIQEWMATQGKATARERKDQ